MSSHDKAASRISKLLRHKSQEYVASPRQAQNLIDIMQHFEAGHDTNACVHALEYVFTNLLKQREFFINVVPLKPVEPTEENQFKQWLRSNYEQVLNRLLAIVENGSPKLQTQALMSLMKLMMYEGKFPVDQKGNLERYVPINRLKLILMKILSNKHNNSHLISKFEEFLIYDDVVFCVWKSLPSLTAKCNPNDSYVMNYLLLLEKLRVEESQENRYLCFEEGDNFIFDTATTKKCLNKIWNCVAFWEHTPATHKQLLIVLLERIMPHLDKPLLLTDFLMDSLDVGGPVSLLALQGIFTLIQEYNLEYPNVYTKLYSMFEPEIFHTKFKARLFYLSDIFLSSTHLPENLVAAFAKRLARLSLVAPSEDVIIICVFIGNLILRHPGLKCLLNHPTGGSTSDDPYVMEERDPLKSNAINSSLWEIRTLQNHALPSVATAASFINNPLPSVEWDLGAVLDSTGDTIFEKELKKNGKMLALAFDKPNFNKNDKLLKYWNI